MTFKNINPYNQEEIESCGEYSDQQIDDILAKADSSFASWRKVSISDRCVCLKKAADLLRKNKYTYARTMNLEMGKPINESISGIE